MKRIAVCLFVFFMVVSLTACEDQLGGQLERSSSQAVLALSPGKSATLLGISGKGAEKCSMDQTQNNGLKPCPAAVPDAKVVFTQTVKITQTLGSFCYTIEDPATHICYFVCWP